MHPKLTLQHWKTKACYSFQDWDIDFLQPPLYIYSFLCVSFSVAAIIILKKLEIFDTNLKSLANIFTHMTIWGIIGKAVFLSRGLLWYSVLFQRWRELQLWDNQRLKKTVNILIFYRTYFFFILVLQHYTCWINLDLDLHLVYFIMPNYPATREWYQTDWLLGEE